MQVRILFPTFVVGVVQLVETAARKLLRLVLGHPIDSTRCVAVRVTSMVQFHPGTLVLAARVGRASPSAICSLVEHDVTVWCEAIEKNDEVRVLTPRPNEVPWLVVNARMHLFSGSNKHAAARCGS